MQGKNKLLIPSAVEAVKKGSVWTKISALVMGAGHFARKQFVKGALYLLLEILFIAYMIGFGGRYLAGLFSGKLGKRVSGMEWNDALGVYEKIKGDNSFLILLYGTVSLVLLILFVVLWLMNLKSSYETDQKIQNGEKPTSFREDMHLLLNGKFYLLLLIPPFLGLLVFTVMPLLFMVLIAFTNYDYNHMPPGRLFGWVGLTNFRLLFSGSGGDGFASAFLRVLVWTFTWAFFATFSNYFFGLIIALMINKKGIRLKKLWRTLFVVAIAVPQFVTLLLMQKVLDRSGILNVILKTDILWLTDTRFGALIPRITIIVVNMWIGIPYTLLMCSGLLLNIPRDFYEAAKIDGANGVQIFMKITLPYMLHMTTPYLITQFVGNINNFNVIWLLTGGGPVDSVLYGNTKAQSTDLLVTWLYRLTTDANPQYNTASVIGIVIFVICATLSLITYHRTGASKNEEVFQ